MIKGIALILHPCSTSHTQTMTLHYPGAKAFMPSGQSALSLGGCSQIIPFGSENPPPPLQHSLCYTHTHQKSKANQLTPKMELQYPREEGK